MTLITGFAFYKATCGQEAADQANNEHKTAQCVGRSITALALLGGFITLYVLSIIGILGMGPLAHLTLNAKIAICATLGGIELLTILGLALTALGCNQPKQEQQQQQKQNGNQQN